MAQQDKTAYKLQKRSLKNANRHDRRAYKSNKRHLKNENRANRRKYKTDTIRARTIRSMGAQSIAQAGGVGTAALTAKSLPQVKEVIETSNNPKIDEAVNKLMDSFEQDTTLKTSNEDGGDVQPGFKGKLYPGRTSR